MRTTILGLADRASNWARTSTRDLTFLMFTLRAESLEILGREEEAKDHVPEIARIRVQRVEPVLVSNRVRVAPQVAKVLHRHKRTIEELVCHGLVLDDVAQHLAARHLSSVERVDQGLLV